MWVSWDMLFLFVDLDKVDTVVFWHGCDTILVFVELEKFLFFGIWEMRFL